MSDIFSEVDEEVRREKLAQLWKRYGNLVIAAAVLMVLAAGGWRGYQYWQSQKAAVAGAAFERAVALAREGKHQEAEAAYAKLAAEAPAAYQPMARIREAAELASRDVPAAVKLYDGIAKDNAVPPLLRDVAALRAGILLVDSAPYEELRQRLEPQTGADKPFRHSAREVLALSAFRVSDAANAKRWFEAIRSDPLTPPGVRSRVDMLAALLAGDGKG